MIVPEPEGLLDELRPPLLHGCSLKAVGVRRNARIDDRNGSNCSETVDNPGPDRWELSSEGPEGLLVPGISQEEPAGNPVIGRVVDTLLKISNSLFRGFSTSPSPPAKEGPDHSPEPKSSPPASFRNSLVPKRGKDFQNGPPPRVLLARSNIPPRRDFTGIRIEKEKIPRLVLRRIDEQRNA